MWRFALKRRGMKVRSSKTEYVCERGDGFNNRHARTETEKLDQFKHLGQPAKEMDSAQEI